MNTLRPHGNHSGNTFTLSISDCLLPGFYVPVSHLMLKHQQDEHSGPSENAGMASGPTCLCVVHYWSDFQFHPFWAKLSLIAFDILSNRDDGTLVIHWSTIGGPWAPLKHKVESKISPQRAATQVGAKDKRIIFRMKSRPGWNQKNSPWKEQGRTGTSRRSPKRGIMPDLRCLRKAFSLRQ